MTVSNPLIANVNLLLPLPQQRSASFVATHVNSAKKTALMVSNGMFAVRAAKKWGVSKPAARAGATVTRNVKTADTRRTHNSKCVFIDNLPILSATWIFSDYKIAYYAV